MECPHCHHKTDSSQEIKCTHCGQRYERGYYEEHQYLEYLHKWVQSHEGELGDQAESLLAEVETRQAEVHQLLGIQVRPAEEVARELSMLQGTSARMPDWCNAVRISPNVTKCLIQYLHQRIRHVKAELDGRSVELVEPLTLEIIDYARSSIPIWVREGALTQNEADLLAFHLQGQRSEYLAKLSQQLSLRRGVLQIVPAWVDMKAMSPAYGESLEKYLLMQVKTMEAEIGEQPVEDSTPLEVIEYSLQALPGWVKNPDINCQHGEADALREFLLAQREEIEKPKVVAETVTPEPAPTPPKPPKERVPFDQWLLSERNIKIALYAGGLLLVIAGLIFIGVNWTRIPGPAKFAITLMVTGLTFLGGYLLFQRPALRIGGVALLGVASGFLALNFAVLYLYVLGPAGLRTDVMWLIASPLCLLLYMLLAYWTKSKLFTYLSMLAVGCTLTAVLIVIAAPEPAYLLAFSISALALLVIAHRLRNTSLSDFTYQPLMIVSHAVMLLTFVGGLNSVSIGSGLSSLPAGSPWLAYTALIVGLVFCLLSAIWSRKALYSYASLFVVGIITLATLWLLEMGPLVYVLTYAMLALLGLILASLSKDTRWSDISYQPLLIVAQLVMPVVIFTAILGWIFDLFFGGVGNPWLAVACMALAVTFYIATNALFKWIAARWAAAMLFPLALVMVLVQLEFSDSALGISMMILALSYMGIGYLLERREGERRSGLPLYATAYILAALVTIMAIPDTEDLAMILFADVILVAVSAAVYRSYWWVYGAAWLFMLPVYLTISLNVSAIHYQGLLMGLLGLNYTVIGYVLGRRELRWGGPFLSAAAFLSVITVVMTWTNPLTASLVLMAVAILYLAAGLWLGWTWLLFPSLLAVNLILLTTNALFFNYQAPFEPILIASYATLGIFLAIGGLILRRFEQSRWSWPLYLVAAVDLGGAYAASLVFGGWLAILVSTALAIILLLFAWWERELITKIVKFPLLTYLGLGVVFISTFYVPAIFEDVYWDVMLPVLAAGLCALYVVISWLIRKEPLSTIYSVPLRYSGLALLAIPIGLSVVNFDMASIAITLGIAGFTFALDATFRRDTILSYVSVVIFVFVSVAMLAVGNNIAAGFTFVAISGLYLFMSLWLKNPWLLLPMMFAVDLAALPFVNLFSENMLTSRYILIISAAVFGVILVLGGTGLRRNKLDSWAWPLYIVGTINLAGAYLAGLIIGGWLAVAISILAAIMLFSYAWLEGHIVARKVNFALLTYLGIGVIFIGHFFVLPLWFGPGVGDFWPAFTAGLCILFVAAAWLLRRDMLENTYGEPLRYAGLVLMAVPLVGSTYMFLQDLINAQQVGLSTVNALKALNAISNSATVVAVTFAIAGVTYAFDAVTRRKPTQVLFSVGAFLVMIWAALLRFGIFEPQAYILPLGIILIVGGGIMRRQDQEKIYRASTLLGLILLMGTAFVQSIITGVIWYALLLAVESILSITWGIGSRCRCYVQVGGAALITNAVVQLGPGIIGLDRWIQIGLTGAILLGGGLVALFKREEILSTRQKVTDGWRGWNP